MRSTEHICPASPYSNSTVEVVPLAGDFTFHHVCLIVGGASLFVTLLSSFFLIYKHATNFSIPREQRQILRIIWTLPVFAAVSFLCILFQDASIYLIPLKDLYMSIALVAFFLLLLAFLDSNSLSNINKSSNISHQIPGEDNPAFVSLLHYDIAPSTETPRKTAIAVYQYPPVMLLVFIVTEITQATGRYCAESNSVHFSHIWLTSITIASTIFAIVSLLRFYKIHKHELAAHKPLAKFAAFKGIVFLNFIQTTIFSILNSTSTLAPTKYASFSDLSVGVPALILSIEMVFFSLAFLRVYRVTHYRNIGRVGHQEAAEEVIAVQVMRYQGGTLGFGALVQAMNISDIGRGFLDTVKGGVSRE